MPYSTTQDLPDSVQHVLSDRAQNIYKEAFNQAWDDCKDPDKSRHSEDREEIAHRVAWTAVKKEYEKVDDAWKKKILN